MTKKKKENEETLEEIDNGEVYPEEIPETLESLEPELNPEKHKTFLRLAKPRTQKVLDSLRILGNCSNKSTYDYLTYEIETIFSTIRDLLSETEDKFYKKAEKGKTLFEF